MTGVLNSLWFILAHPNNSHKRVRTLLTIFWWKINQLFLHWPMIVPFPLSLRCIAYPDSSRGSLLVYVGFPDTAEFSFLRKYIKKGDTCIDVGANIGEYSLLFAALSQSQNIFSFEPVFHIAARCKENVILNNFEKNIHLHTEVICDKNGSILFSAQAESELSHISKAATTSSDGKKLPAITLDSFISQQKLSKVDLLKIDVEGAEGLVFVGAKKSLQNGVIKAILVEINPRSNQYTNLQPILKAFPKQGYHFFLLDTESLTEVSATQVLEISDTTNMVIIHQSVLSRIAHAKKVA